MKIAQFFALISLVSSAHIIAEACIKHFGKMQLQTCRCETSNKIYQTLMHLGTNTWKYIISRESHSNLCHSM
jgi:hypothetical protein